MQRTTNSLMAKYIRSFFTVLAGTLLLAGCGSDDDKKDKKEDDKKPPYERVVILKERFDQLEADLDEMERDLNIQKKRIEKTRETAKAIKRSLIKGNLKGYSIDTISTDPLVVAALEKRQEKDSAEQAEEAEEEESENFVLNTLLLIAFVILLIAIFWVALRDRNQTTPYDLGQGETGNTEPTGSPHSAIDELTPNVDTSSSGYGDLTPPRPSSERTDIPPADETSGDEEPRQ